MPMIDVGWLIDPIPAPQQIAVDMVTTVDTADIRGTLTCVELAPATWLYLGEADVHAPCAIEPTGTLTGTWIDFMLMPAGQAVVETPDGVRGQIDGRTGIAFRLVERRARYYLPVVGKAVTLNVALGVDRLADVLGDEMPGPVAPLLQTGANRSDVLPYRVTAALRKLARGFFEVQVPDALKRLYLEGCALQFVALVLAELPAGEPAGATRPLTQREASMVAAAHDRLVADLRDPPTVAEIAAELGLSASRLNEGLKAVHGATAFDIVRNARLEHARIVLETTELPLKVLAYRVGYSDVSNFIHAFKARFGSPPRRFLRARGSDGDSDGGDDA